jgi:hypothetical protein
MRIKNKKTYKLSRGKCVLCGENNLATLDIHRILEGANGGDYHHENTVCLCANCHRLYKKRLKENKKSILDITVDADVIL